VRVVAEREVDAEEVGKLSLAWDVERRGHGGRRMCAEDGRSELGHDIVGRGDECARGRLIEEKRRFRDAEVGAPLVAGREGLEKLA